jgi:hypothetical protein
MMPGWMDRLNKEDAGLSGYDPTEIKTTMTALRTIGVVRELGGASRAKQIVSNPEALREMGQFFIRLADEIDNLPPAEADIRGLGPGTE